jgi:S1-C subfamily serine protease
MSSLIPTSPADEPRLSNAPAHSDAAASLAESPAPWQTPAGRDLVPTTPGTPPFEGLPPERPFGGGGAPPFDPTGGQHGPRNRRWRSGLAALVLLGVLGVGFGAGAAIVSLHDNTGQTVVLGASSAPAVSSSSGTLSLQQNLEQVASAVKPSVVEITSTGGQQEGIGSGEILTRDGYIVTNDHVVAGFSTFTVTLSNGKAYTAQVVGQDPQDDLAVLKIAANNLQPIAFADSSKVQVGQFAVAVGSPLGQQNTVTFGIVSGLNRTASEAPSGPASQLTGLIQTSAQVNPGNSGGALVNLSGQLIGIPTLEATNTETGTPANGIGYAIPSNRVQYVASQLIQHGKLISTDQGFLGIQGQDVTPPLAQADGLSVQSGVLVAGFAADAAGQSPAQQAGLQSGDVIVAVNGQPVASNSDLAAAVATQTPGTKITLTVVRGSNQQSITVTLGERPTNTQG